MKKILLALSTASLLSGASLSVYAAPPSQNEAYFNLALGLATSS